MLQLSVCISRVLLGHEFWHLLVACFHSALGGGIKTVTLELVTVPLQPCCCYHMLLAWVVQLGVQVKKGGHSDVSWGFCWPCSYLSTMEGRGVGSTGKRQSKANLGIVVQITH